MPFQVFFLCIYYLENVFKWMFLQQWLARLKLSQDSMILSGSVTGETLSLPFPTPVTVDGTVILTPGMGRESNCWNSPWAEILNEMT